MDFRLHFFVNCRVVGLTPYRCVVVFHFWCKFQHRLGGEPSIIGLHGLYVRFDVVHDFSSGTVRPGDLQKQTTS